MTTITNTQLAARMSELVDFYQGRERELQDWMTGVVGGGVNSDGRYPLTDWTGEVRYTLSPAQLEFDVDDLVVSAFSHKVDAEAAATAAAASESVVLYAETLADGHRTAALGYRNDAQTAASDAANVLVNVQAARTHTYTARDIALGAQASATASEAKAQLWAEEALGVPVEAGMFSAKHHALTAEEFRDEAEGFAIAAAQWDIDNFYTKAATDSEIAAAVAALVDSSPGTLDTLNELAAALGDDPNFAATMSSQIAGKSDLGHGHAWSEITAKPTTFAPSAHAHPISDVTGLQATLDGKAASVHSHGIDQVTGLQAALDGKSATGHGHAVSDVAGLQTALDGKAGASHSHVIGNVTGLQSALDGKSAAGHGHTIANVTGLQAALDGKSAIGHGHAIADVTGLQAAIDGKAAVGHTHSITNVTGLQTALDGKSSTSHTHAWGAITGKPSTFTPSAHTHSVSDLTDGLSTFVVGAKNGPAGDLNDFTYQSQVHSVNVTTNGPAGNGWYNVVNVRHRGGSGDGTSYGGQLVWGMNGYTDYIGFRSNTTTNTWTGWKELWHDGNFDPASKSDTGHVHSYLPLSGGTMTGTLNVTNVYGPTSGPMVLGNAGGTAGTYGFWDGVQFAGAGLITQGGVNKYPRLSMGWRWNTQADPTDLAFRIEAGNTGSLTADINLIPANGGDVTWNGAVLATQSWATGQLSASGHTHSSLPLPGGTITGALTISSNAPRVELTEGSGNDWWLIQDNDTFSLRLNNTGTYPISVGTDRVLKTNGNTVWHAGNFTPTDYLPRYGSAITTQVNIDAQSDFVIRDSTNAPTNFIWRQKSANLLYIGTAYAVPTFRYNVDLNGFTISNGSFSGNGSALTALNASNLSSGTVADARIPTLAISKISGLQTALDGKSATSHTHSYLPLAGGTITGNLALANTTLSGVRYLEGQYGNIARSTDEWLRLNDGGTHTTGIYCGNSTVRTDGELQVGASGATLRASASLLTYKGEGILRHTDGSGNASGNITVSTSAPSGGSNGDIWLEV